MAHPTDVIVGKRIRAARTLAGTSQEDLASRIGITFQQLQKYEKAENRISASRLSDLAHALSIPIQSLFEQNTPDNPLILDKATLKMVASFSQLSKDKQKLVSKLVKDL